MAGCPLIADTLPFLNNKFRMKRFLALVAICSALAANASIDSVKVVKGQVSDYYIPVVTQYQVTGVVTDGQGLPWRVPL